VLRRVAWKKFSDVSEALTASIIKAITLTTAKEGQLQRRSVNRKHL
jgi:hypothetical protein